MARGAQPWRRLRAEPGRPVANNGCGVAFWFYLRGLRTCSPAVAGLFINLVPVFGVTAAAVILDERLVGRQWLGAVIVLLAVAVLALVQSRADRPRAR